MVLQHVSENHGGFPRWLSVGKTPRKKRPVTWEKIFAWSYHHVHITRSVFVDYIISGHDWYIWLVNIWLVNKQITEEICHDFPSWLRVTVDHCLRAFERRRTSDEKSPRKSAVIFLLVRQSTIVCVLSDDGGFPTENHRRNPLRFSLSCGRTIKLLNCFYFRQFGIQQIKSGHPSNRFP